MNRLLPPLLAALTIVALVGMLACEEEDVGVPCQMRSFVGTDGGAAGTAQIESQAMDCRSRLCLHFGGVEESRSLCTRICDNDGDCPDGTETCPNGFTCIPATETTKLACCKMCVCKRFVVGSDAGTSVSSFCRNYTATCPKL